MINGWWSRRVTINHIVCAHGLCEKLLNVSNQRRGDFLVQSLTKLTQHEKFMVRVLKYKILITERSTEYALNSG